MKATGDNEVEVITNRAGTVKCWMYGNEHGNGYCRAVDNPTNWAYERLLQFRDMNFMVCQVGVAPGGTNGDVIVVPFKATDGVVGDAWTKKYKPGEATTATAGNFGGMWSSDVL